VDLRFRAKQRARKRREYALIEGAAPSAAVQGKRSAPSVAGPAVNGMDPLDALQRQYVNTKHDK
jgi:hypothetical protein